MVRKLQIKVKTAEYVNNEKVEIEQEWHKQVNVFAQIIGKRPNIILGYENVTCNGEQNKQEYEPNVGIKLLNKIKYIYGTGIDVIVGNARWDIENNGFNELKQYWHLGHCFIAHSNGINVMLQFIVLSYNLWELYIYSHIHNFEERKISKIGFIGEIIELINSLKYCDIWISST